MNKEFSKEEIIEAMAQAYAKACFPDKRYPERTAKNVEGSAFAIGLIAGIIFGDEAKEIAGNIRDRANEIWMSGKASKGLKDGMYEGEMTS